MTVIDTLTHLPLNQDVLMDGWQQLALNHFFLAIETSLVENLQNTWNNLLKTGQLWAFLVGMFVGWWIRSVLPS
ncbi:MAG: hypothetical protein ACRC8A_15575 [Microcoleaceae cyanobacterium]